MTLRIYVRIWIFLTALLAYEFFAINFFQQLSVVHLLQITLGALPTIHLNTQAGKRISVFLGWTGFGIMCLTNLYSFRKRIGLFKKVGSLPRWLDFHIFCGLVGPTFILFHTNFKVGGLVAISFWSMVISFASGVVGRYFYMQLASTRAELEAAAESALHSLKNAPPLWRGSLSEDALEGLRMRALALAGAGELEGGFLALRSLLVSFAGDLRLRFRFDRVAASLPEQARRMLRGYVVTRRRVLFLKQFQELMGYWHSFHLPFAFFMYLVAIIHIATALIMYVPD